MLKSRRPFMTLFRGLLASSMVLGHMPAHAGGVDGVEFQPIPVNINNQCSAVILKGTNSFKGYAFKMPRVMLSVDKNLEDLFEIIPKGNGQYTLRFGLFFPLKDDTLEIRRERTNLVLNTCNDDVIVAELNEAGNRLAEIDGSAKDKEKKTTGNKDAGTVYEDKIQALSPLPVSAIEVSIDGFPGMTKMIGVPEGNLLGYQNSDLIADFSIPDESTYEELKAHLTGRLGLSVNVKIYFTAKSRNGAVSVKIDTNNIADSLEGMAGGQLGITDPTKLINIPIGDVDLRGYLAKAIASSSANIKTEESDNEAFNRMAYQVIERVIAQLPSMPQLPGQSWNPNACINNPLGANCNGQGSAWPNTWPSTNGNTGFPDPNNPGGNGTFNTPPPPSVGTPGPQIPRKDWSTSTNGKYFSLGMVINRLRQAQNIDLNWENLGKRETQSFTTKSIIRGAIPDPGYKTLNAVADDKDGVTYTSYIKAGQQIILKIPSRRELVTSFEKRRQYFSKDEIRRQGISSYFALLQEAIKKNGLEETVDKENGGYVAIYRQNQDLTKFNRWWNNVAQATYYWGSAELRRRTTMKEPSDLDLENSELAGLPLKVMFSETGTRFPVAALAADNDKWSGRYEDGQIILVAKKDLGYMTVRNYDKVPTSVRVAEKYLFELKEPVVNPKDASSVNQSIDKREYRWFKYNGDAGLGIETVGEPNLTPYDITKSVYVLLVKVGAPDAAANAPLAREEIKASVTPMGPVTPIQYLNMK